MPEVDNVGSKNPSVDSARSKDDMRLVSIHAQKKRVVAAIFVFSFFGKNQKREKEKHLDLDIRQEVNSFHLSQQCKPRLTCHI